MVILRLLNYFLFSAAVSVSLTACMNYGPNDRTSIEIDGGKGVFIVNEGNFMYGNASLSYYDPVTKVVENEIIIRVNGFKLGDVAQSMTIHDGKGYVVVNNSGIIFVIDPETFEYIGEITGINSPRYIHFVSDEKAYITDMYSYSITIFNPQTLEITGRISTKTENRTQPSTEQMVQYGKYVFTNCWSYDNRILVIDTEQDKVVDEIIVGKQPTSLVIDKYGKIWTITDGGYEGSQYGQEAPALYRIDAATRRVEKSWNFNFGESGSELCIDGSGEHIYFLNKHVWRMDVTSDNIPEEPYLYNTTTNYWYGLAVDPETSELYLADAIDYTQRGWIYRYSPAGELIDKFKVGIIPGAFCFKLNDDGENNQ